MASAAPANAHAQQKIEGDPATSLGLYKVEAQPVQGSAAVGLNGARASMGRGRLEGSRLDEARTVQWARVAACAGQEPQDQPGRRRESGREAAGSRCIIT